MRLGLALTGVARAGMGGLFVVSLLAFKRASLGVVLSGLRPLFVAALAFGLLHERQFLRRKIIASLVAALGIGIMFWK